MVRELLGEVTCPSGTLMVVDMGLLGLWSHWLPPLLPDGVESDELGDGVFPVERHLAADGGVLRFRILLAPDDAAGDMTPAG